MQIEQSSMQYTQASQITQRSLTTLGVGTKANVGRAILLRLIALARLYRVVAALQRMQYEKKGLGLHLNHIRRPTDPSSYLLLVSFTGQPSTPRRVTAQKHSPEVVLALQQYCPTTSPTNLARQHPLSRLIHGLERVCGHPSQGERAVRSTCRKPTASRLPRWPPSRERPECPIFCRQPDWHICRCSFL